MYIRHTLVWRAHVFKYEFKNIKTSYLLRQILVCTLYLGEYIGYSKIFAFNLGKKVCTFKGATNMEKKMFNYASLEGLEVYLDLIYFL